MPSYIALDRWTSRRRLKTGRKSANGQQKVVPMGTGNDLAASLSSLRKEIMVPRKYRTPVAGRQASCACALLHQDAVKGAAVATVPPPDRRCCRLKNVELENMPLSCAPFGAVETRAAKQEGSVLPMSIHGIPAHIRLAKSSNRIGATEGCAYQAVGRCTPNAFGGGVPLTGRV